MSVYLFATRLAQSREFRSGRGSPTTVGSLALDCAHRATLIHLIDPSELVCFSSLGRARMLVYVRPSNEALPIDFPHFALRGAARLSFTARIEGAHSDRAASASKKDGLAVPLPPFSGRAFREHRTNVGVLPILFIAGALRARRTCQSP